MIKKLLGFPRFFLRDMKLQYKLLLVNLLLILAPTLLIFIFLYGNLSKIITDNAMDSEQTFVNQTASTVEGTISQLSYAMETITSNTFLSKVTYTSDPVQYLLDPLNMEDARDFFAIINSLIDGEFITSIKIYLPDDSGALASDNAFSGIIRPYEDALGSHWHGIFNGSPSKVSLLCPSFYLTRNEIVNDGGLAYIKKCTNVANPAGQASYVAIYFNKEHLTDSLKQNLGNRESVYYLLNSRNSFVASSNSVKSGTYFMRYEDIPQILSSNGSFHKDIIGGEEVYMTYREISDSDWRLVSVIPTDSIFSENNSIMIKTSFMYLAFILFAFISALLLSNNIVSRLSKVISKMNARDHQTPLPLKDTHDQDEIGVLATNYNAMVNRINELIQQQQITAEKLKISEVNALQAQINPHFLYNMLDMINWLAKSGKEEQVSIAVRTLSQFYKLTLSKKNITTSIREELKHVELYVALQNMRYEDNIEFIIDVPDEILGYEIPKLVLQPIVENSIQHGIFEREEKAGSIVIMAWQEMGDIVFVVSDTGMGIPEEKLPTILDGNNQGGTGSNIGIYNTHLRLQLLYGEKYGLYFESTYGTGTDVQVRIPAVEYKPRN